MYRIFLSRSEMPQAPAIRAMLLQYLRGASPLLDIVRDFSGQSNRESIDLAL